MEQTIVRLSSLKLYHIKNTKYGEIRMPDADSGSFGPGKAGIVGIYGQNGSGKTAVIDALFLAQMILMGEALPGELHHYIDVQEESAAIELQFTVSGNRGRFLLGYTVVLERKDKQGVLIASESMTTSKHSEGRKPKRQTFISYTREDGASVFTPRARLQEVINGDKNRRAGLTAARKIAEIQNCSYIFGESSLGILCEDSGPAFADYGFLIQALHRYARMSLFVIRNTHSGAISADVLLPMAFSAADGAFVTKGDFVISLREPTLVPEERYEILKKIIHEGNLVLETIIPGLSVGIYDYGTILSEGGVLARKVDLVSVRGDVEIPIRYESEGIIKMVSILNAMIWAYNHPGVCLAVDELDAGIYEYLLGELFDIFLKGGKGQLIFTSHNLRPLEMLPADSILFSTANPNNRYIRMHGAGGPVNLRDAYLRCITLGGQKETVYSETDSLRIARAFRKAGREMEHAT